MCGICGCDEGELEKNNILQHSHDYDDGVIFHLEQDILIKNNQFAKQNRNYFIQHNIVAINIISSPGSGKTTLLVKTIAALKNKVSIAVIEGDQHTQFDADRIRETQVPVIQINTGKMCHLDAHQVGHAVEKLALKPNSLLFIENVGNLICPALFDLGANCNVVVLSVTEGEDKPLKYPDVFSQANIVIINKMDLLPYITFDINKCIQYVSQIKPDIKVLKTSATMGTGLNDWRQVLKENLLECHESNQSVAF